MYPISIAAILIRLVIHRLVQHRELQGGEVLSLGLFEGAALYHAINENAAVGAGCFIGFGLRVLLEHFKNPNLRNFATSLLGLTLGILLATLAAQLWEDATHWMYDEEWIVREERREERHIRRRDREHHHKRRTSRNHIEGAPDPDPASQQVTRRTNFDVPDAPVMAQWESLQKPLPALGVENEVMELRRRASAAAGQTRKLQEERKWAYSQGNPARAFQLGWDIRRFQSLSESLNREAAEKLGLARSQSLASSAGEVSVDGLSSQDAIAKAEKHLKDARDLGDTHMRISLSGGGTEKFSYTEGNTKSDVTVTRHHESHYHSVRPALESHLRLNRHSVIQDPTTNDVLIVSVETLPPPSESASTTPASDEWSRALD